MTVLLDSYCWFEYFFGSPAGRKVNDLINSEEDVIVSAVNVFEVYRKFLQNRPSEAREKRLFMTTRSAVVDLSEEIATQAAELAVKHDLHASDALVYATALKNKATLVTGDEHFKTLPSVKLI